MDQAARQRVKSHKERKAKARAIAAAAYTVAERGRAEARMPKRRTPTFGDALAAGSAMQIAAMAAWIDSRPLEPWDRSTVAVEHYVDQEGLLAVRQITGDEFFASPEDK